MGWKYIFWCLRRLTRGKRNIRYSRYLKNKGTPRKDARKRRFKEGKCCVVCGTDKDLTIDHIRPLSKGGTNVQSNWQIMCRFHNNKKGSKYKKDLPN